MARSAVDVDLAYTLRSHDTNETAKINTRAHSIAAGMQAHKESAMPRGDKSSYSSKQKREAEHIEEGYKDKGVSSGEAARRAWATVNKQDGGGKKSGSARKKSSGARKSAVKKSSAKKSSSKKTGARKSATKKSSSKKSAAKKSSTRKSSGARKSTAKKSSSRKSTRSRR